MLINLIIILYISFYICDSITEIMETSLLLSVCQHLLWSAHPLMTIIILSLLCFSPELNIQVQWSFLKAKCVQSDFFWQFLELSLILDKTSLAFYHVILHQDRKQLLLVCRNNILSMFGQLLYFLLEIVFFGKLT